MEHQKKLFFEQPITKVIRARTSVRTYDKRQLPADLKDKLTQYCAELKGPFHVKIRFKLIDNLHFLKESNLKLGTYGVIKDAPLFIAAAVEKADHDLEELGYVFEKLILYATSLGLGTCWLGGSFTKSEFAKAMELKSNEFLPVVTPVGYASNRRRLIDSIIRFGAGSKNRKPWDELFFKETFSNKLSETEAGTFALPLEMLKLAPSASNKQPWRVVKEGKAFHFYLEHTKGYASALGYDIQRIDLGIGMCHFELTALELGLKGDWCFQEPKIGKVPVNTDYIMSWIEK